MHATCPSLSFSAGASRVACLLLPHPGSFASVLGGEDAVVCALALFWAGSACARFVSLKAPTLPYTAAWVCRSAARRRRPTRRRRARLRARPRPRHNRRRCISVRSGHPQCCASTRLNLLCCRLFCFVDVPVFSVWFRGESDFVLGSRAQSLMFSGSLGARRRTLTNGQ